jgi:hypothetical protein
MALQVQERNAAIGAAVAAGIPVATNALGFNLEDHVVNLADAVFEGDAGSAAFVSGIGFTILGGLFVLAAWIGPLNGNAGIASMGLGMGLFGLGAQSIDVARRS